MPPFSSVAPRCILHGGLSSFPPSTLPSPPPFRGILRRTKAAKEITKESPSGASRVDGTVFTRSLSDSAAESIYMSSVRKNVIVRRTVRRPENILPLSSPSLPLLHSPRNLSRPFQLRDKGLLRYRLHPPTRGSSSRSANKTPWPCFTRDIKRALPRLFPLGSLLCKRRASPVYTTTTGGDPFFVTLSRCDLEQTK